MSVDKILNDWKKLKFKPVTWLEGEEEYYIDQVINYAEHKILTEAEAGFNLTVFYGKDADWAAVINACRRYPMFAERQVVLLKEAQQMRDLDKLEAYIEKPLTSTIFVVSYKEKKVDGRSKLAKLLKEKAELYTTKKMYDNQLPDWTNALIHSKGYEISQKALLLLVDHIGNDLSRIENEIDKLLVKDPAQRTRHAVDATGDNPSETYTQEIREARLQFAAAAKRAGKRPAGAPEVPAPGATPATNIAANPQSNISPSDSVQ